MPLKAKKQFVIRGLTILESVIVIIIVGILYLAINPLFIKAERLVLEMATRHSLVEMRSAIRLYYILSATVGDAKMPPIDFLNMNQNNLSSKPFWTVGRPRNYLSGFETLILAPSSSTQSPVNRCSPLLENPYGWTYRQKTGQVWANTDDCKKSNTFKW